MVTALKNAFKLNPSQDCSRYSMSSAELSMSRLEGATLFVHLRVAPVSCDCVGYYKVCGVFRGMEILPHVRYRRTFNFEVQVL